MKVENNRIRSALLLLVLGTGSLVAQPETAELREPRAIRVVEPMVSYTFGRYGITGKVEVTFQLNEQGHPRNIKVEAASHTEYAESVLNALRQWRFEQPEVAGITYRLPVLFN